MRFYKLRQNLHMVDNLDNGFERTDRLWKVRPIYDELQSCCHQLPLEARLCIDEQIIPFKENLNIRQHKPKTNQHHGE